MRKSEHLPTPATAHLLAKRIRFSSHLADYNPTRPITELARTLGVAVHQVVLTQVLETEQRVPLLMLVNADRVVPHALLASQEGCTRVFDCNFERTQKHTGYLPGAVSPFGIAQMPTVYVDACVMVLEDIYISGGRRGYWLRMHPADLRKALDIKVIATST